MATPDDIPLEKVVTHSSSSGVRTASHTATARNNVTFGGVSNEKTGKGSLFRRGGRRRVVKPGTPRTNESEVEHKLQIMGRIYQKILNFSFITRYIIYVLPLAALLAIPIIIGFTAAPHATLGGIRIVWLFIWLEIVWTSLWVSKAFAQTLPFAFQFFIGVVSTGVKKYTLVIKAIEIPLSLVGWALVSLLTFTPIMLRNPDTKRQFAPNTPALQSWQAVVRQILAAALVSSLVFLAERTLIQLISINYHRKQFSDKIKENKHQVHLLGLLYDASRTLFPAYCNEFAEEDYIIADSLGISSGKGSGGATPFRLLQNVGRVGDKITSAFGNVAHEISGKEVFNPNSAHSVVVEALEKKRCSEALAKRLWMSFVVEGRDALYEEDIVEVLGSERRAEAEEAFRVFDQDGNGDVTLDEAILTIIEIGRDRLSIANSMHDVDQAINVLDSLLSGVVLVIAVLILVAFLNSSFTTMLATAGTALLSLSFVFATTTQEVLGSCIFLFVKHPFDIGDRVDLNEGADQLTVEHISLLFTVFKRVQSGKMVQIPNIVLNNLWVENVSRSKAMREQISIFCEFGVKFEDVQALKTEMTKFVTAKENTRDFQPDIDIEVRGIGNMDKMELMIECRHKSNWANENIRAARRSKFMCALVLALRKVPIYGPGGGDPALGTAGNPNYSVSLEPEVAQANKNQASKDKEAKRIVNQPTAPKSSASTATYVSGRHTEITAINNISSRDATTDPRDDALNTRADTTSPNNGGRTSSSSDEDRNASVDEVRGLLKRESTRGRRQASPQQSGSTTSTQQPITFPSPPRAQYVTMPPVTTSSGVGSPAVTATPPLPPNPPPSGRPMQANYLPGNAFRAHPPYAPPPPMQNTSQENVRPNTAGSSRTSGSTRR